jgi:hypothetical protein
MICDKVSPLVLGEEDPHRGNNNCRGQEVRIHLQDSRKTTMTRKEILRGRSEMGPGSDLIAMPKKDEDNYGSLFNDNIFGASPQGRIISSHPSNFRVGHELAFTMEGEWKCGVILLQSFWIFESTCPFRLP